MVAKRLPPGMADELKYYVYLYTDPDTKTPFYVGKGKGNRCFAHLDDDTECEKVRYIQRLRKAGKEPLIEILVHGLDEITALRVEMAVIEVVGVANLTNQVSGYQSRVYGRTPLDILTAHVAPTPIEITDPILLIRINQRYYNGITAQELYDSTRGIWKIGVRRHDARYAMAVYDGIVREVYRIDRWYPAGTTDYPTRRGEDLDDSTRWEFTGAIAEQTIRNRYQLKSVREYFPANMQNPVRYVNC